MARWLRQSTIVDVPIGPFVDQADGFTPETTLTLTQPDIRLKKNAAAWAQKNGSQTLSHEENGYYEVTLDATDTNTLGLLRLAVNESGALPVFEDFLVVPANVFDSFFSTDLLQIDVAQWMGTVPNGLTSGNVRTIVMSMSADVIVDTAFASTSGQRPIRSGFNAQAGANGSITLDTSASSVNDFYKGTRIYLTSGTGAGQSRLCTGYNGTTKEATVEPNWITNPASGTQFAILEDASALSIATGGIASTSFAAGAINAAAIAAGAIDDDAVAADMDSYAAKMWVIKDSTTKDEYGVTFLKNGQPIETGITSPLIDYVKKLSDGSILVNDATLIDQSNGDYYYGETTNKLAGGNAYMMRVTASIDGSTRIFKQQIGRDSV